MSNRSKALAVTKTANVESNPPEIPTTACFSLGVKKSQKLLKKYNAKAVFVDKNNKVYVSDGVEFTLTAKDYKIV